MEKLGLILNFLGALMLVIASIVGSHTISIILSEIADKYGYWSAEPIPKNMIARFRNNNALAKWLNIGGVVLFLIGFTIQVWPW